MASTYSPNLRIELIGTGDQAGTWGTTTDNTDAYLLESAIAGYQAVPIAPTSNNQVLTYINGASTTASVNQAVYAALKLTASAVSANFNLFAPPASKTYIINNQTGYQCTLYNSTTIGNTTAAGTGVAIPNGATVAVYSDGINFFDHSNYAINNFSVGGNALVNGTTTLVGTATAPTPANGDSSTNIATTAFVAYNGTPSGSLLMWPTASAPTGYLLCNGGAVSRTTYAALFAVVGTTFGAGDGSTTFNLPNYVDRMPIGVGTIAASIGATGGSATTTLSGSNLPAHTHSFSGSGSGSTNNASASIQDPGHAHGVPAGGNYVFLNGGNIVAGTSGGGNLGYEPNTGSATTGIYDSGHAHGFSVSVSGTTGSTGSGTAATTISPYLGINFIIKT